MEYISPRISVQKKSDVTSIVILASADNRKRNLLGLWLFAWTVCGVIVFMYFFRITDSKEKLMVFVWLCFWVYFEYMVAKAFRWRSSGVEKMKIKDGYLYMMREIGGKGKKKVYEIDVIKDLRRQDEANDLKRTLNRSYWVVGGETLAFDYFGKSVRFGLQLDEKESSELLKTLQREMKASRKKAS